MQRMKVPHLRSLGRLLERPSPASFLRSLTCGPCLRVVCAQARTAVPVKCRMCAGADGRWPPSVITRCCPMQGTVLPSSVFPAQQAAADRLRSSLKGFAPGANPSVHAAPSPVVSRVGELLQAHGAGHRLSSHGWVSTLLYLEALPAAPEVL